MNFFKSNRILCFSPPVMLATIFIELGLAAWIASRYAASSVRNLTITTLLCLGGFQLAEFNVCGGQGSTLVWSRIGFILITLLPPLGFHLILKLQTRSAGAAVPAYLAAAGFIGAFAFAPTALNAAVCTGNYVIFDLAPNIKLAYYLFYDSVLIAGLIAAFYGAARSVGRVRASLLWMVAGYLSFIIPSIGIYLIAPASGVGLPSIMCGFAVTLAIILAFKVLPNAIAVPYRQSFSGWKLNP